MRVLHYASRSLATVTLLALAAGCGSDSTAPDTPFSPEGTQADIAAIDESFQSAAFESYHAAAVHISAAVGGSAAIAVRAMPSAAIATGGKAAALRYGAALSKQWRPGLRPSLSAASIPAEYEGVTFTWDAETDTYVPSDLPGAPGNGVRFVLYAVNPVTSQPIEPLVEIGHVDLTSSETATSATARALVVSGGVTYLDYTVAVSGSSSDAAVTVAGFVTNGTDRVNFDLETTLIAEQSDEWGLVLDYLLVVPTRGGFRIDLESSITGMFTESPSFTLDMTARGDHGTVTVQGGETNGTGSFEVEVNGALFATITLDGEGLPVFTGATGQPLTQTEQAAMVAIWAMFTQAYDFFLNLTNPVF